MGRKKHWIKVLDDDDLMMFGKHTGVRMKDVPDEHFRWLYQQCWLVNYKQLMEYIERNAERIGIEVREHFKRY